MQKCTLHNQEIPFSEVELKWPEIGNQTRYHFTIMIKNYLTIAFRNLLRQKSSAILNISGLTLGITASIVLFLLLQHLNSFDKFQSNYNRIYRVVTTSDGNDGKNYTSGVPSVLPPAFLLDFPEAEEVVFTQYNSEALILVPQNNGENKKFSEEAGVVFTEANFFKIFDRGILLGDAVKALDEPNEAIISKKTCREIFWTERCGWRSNQIRRE